MAPPWAGAGLSFISIRFRKNRTQPFNVRAAQVLIPKIDVSQLKNFNTHQGKFTIQWLNVFPCKNIYLMRSSCAARYGYASEQNLCLAHVQLLQNGRKEQFTVFLATTVRDDSHIANLNSLTLAFLDLPSIVGPTLHNRRKTPACIMMLSKMTKQLECENAVVLTLALSAINQGSL